jgi:TolB protein
MLRRSPFVALAAFAGLAVLGLGAGAPPQQPPQPQDKPQTELNLKVSGEAGVPPRFAVPDFIALSGDAETLAAAQTIGQVLWDDLAFEREFDMIPRDTYASIPRARSMTDVPFDRWRELGADGLVIGTVQKTGNDVRVEVRLFQVRDQRSVFGREYHGSIANPRLYAHTISDEIFEHQVALRGVARTRLAFDSNRDAERVAETVEAREVKEVYICDYDGANQRRVTVNRRLNITPVWSPDGRSIAYTSYRRGFPDIFVSHIYEALPPDNPTKGVGHNFLPAYSPDGTKIAFMSNRDGNPEIYVMNADGGGVRRLTNSPAIDVTPTWSPNGTQIAFTSDRSGTPQIYVMSADGLEAPRKLTSESYCDRPTWSPPPYNEIAYASRTGGGYDIKILDLASGQIRQITFGEGSNESPAFAPNGRHLAFMSTRSGKSQIYTIGRDGKGLKQITKLGHNEMPNWSR